MFFENIIIPFFGYSIIFVFGSTLGSFISSWIWRVHVQKDLWSSKSQCIHCGCFLKWRVNIPIYGYISIKGRCDVCHGIIPWNYFAAELIMGSILVVIFYFNNFLKIIPNFWVVFQNIFLVTILSVIFIYDALYKLVLPKVIILGIIGNIFFKFIILSQSEFSIFNFLLSIGVGGGFFLLQYVFSKGKWIGGGDVFVGIFMGTLLSFENLIIALFIAYTIGAMYGLSLLISNHAQRFDRQVPLAPFLAIGTLFAFYGGNYLVNYYHNIF